MKSRILTPSSALPARPHGFALGRGRPLLEDFAPPFLAFSFTTFFDDFFAETLAFAALDFAFATLLRVAIVCFLSLMSALRRVSMALHCFFRSALCGLRLLIRPLSLVCWCAQACSIETALVRRAILALIKVSINAFRTDRACAKASS